MNKIGIHYGYWARDWDVDFVPFVSGAKKLGFDILEVNPGSLMKKGTKENDRLKEEAARLGIELTFCIGLTPDLDLASSDRLVRKNGVAYLKRLAGMVRQMGGRGVSGILYGWWPTSIAEGVNEKGPALERSIECMKEVMKVVEDYELTFSMEAVNRFEHYLLNTSKEAVEYVEQVGSDRCKILLDTFHMNIEEDSFQEAIITAGDKLGHFHLGETNRRPPGQGRIPWDEVMGALRKIGYSGAIVMEPFLMPGGAVGRDIRVYRDLLGSADLDEQAQAACTFVRGKV
jgi:D-psicose/D-tagatose/L-ribulose 3-epimerase